jgi:hypothetical protein
MAFSLPYVDHQPRESVSLKCTNEDNEVKEHAFLVIQPENHDEQVDPLEVLKLAKRLIICTSCGAMKLIN